MSVTVVHMYVRRGGQWRILPGNPGSTWTAPSTVPGVVVTPQQTTAVVTWGNATAGTNPLATYQLKLGAGAPISVPISSHTFTFSGLTGGTTYQFSVAAVDITGAAGLPVIVTATTTNPTAANKGYDAGYLGGY